MFKKKIYLLIILILFSFNLVEVKADTIYDIKSCDEIDKNNLDNYWVERPDSNNVSQSCLYYYQLPNYCVFFQINLYEDTFDSNYYTNGTFWIDVDLDEYSMENYLEHNVCPPSVYLNKFTSYGDGGVSYTFQTLRKKNFWGRLGGTQVFTEIILSHELNKSDYNSIIIENVIEIDSCDDLLSKDIIELLSNGVMYIRILLPIILLVLGIVDFATAIFAGKDDDMKKTASRFIKRVIICVAIFLVPTVLKLVLQIAHLIWPNIDPSLCNIL